MNIKNRRGQQWRGLQTVGGWNGRSEVYARLRGGDRVN